MAIWEGFHGSSLPSSSDAGRKFNFHRIFIETVTKNEIQSKDSPRAFVPPRIFIRELMFIKFTLFAFHACLA